MKYDLRKPTVWAAFIPKRMSVVLFLHRPVSEELEAVYQKDWKCRKTTYDQEEMNDENRY